MASDVVVAYRVGYLGSCPAISTATGLAMVQKALRELYLKKATKLGASREEVQRPRTLEITNYGLAVKYEEMRTKTGNIVEVTEMYCEFSTIMLWAALRFCAHKNGKHRKKKLECAFLPLICTDYNLESSMFTPLDSKYSFVTKVKHPALFACVLRHPRSPRVMECHAFVCRNDTDALEIAWNLHEALMQFTKMNRLARSARERFGTSSRNSVIPLVSPNGRLQRVEDQMRSSLSSKKSTVIKGGKKNTVVFADICTESSGRGSASSDSDTPDDSNMIDNIPSTSGYSTSFTSEKSIPTSSEFGECSYRKLNEDENLYESESASKTSDLSSSTRDSTSTKADNLEMNLDWHNRHKIFGGIRVLPSGRPPSRPSSREGPDLLSHVPDSGGGSFSEDSQGKYNKMYSSHDNITDNSRKFSPHPKKSLSLHELSEINLNSRSNDDLQLPAENLSKKIYREKKKVKENRSVKSNSKSKSSRFPKVRLYKWRQRDSSLDGDSDTRDSDTRDSGSGLSNGNSSQFFLNRDSNITSDVSRSRFVRNGGIYQDGDSWKKYYWKDNADLDLEKTMCSTDWDVRKFSHPPDARINPHIKWSRTNLESSLGYIP